jgi:hypothetical protein
MNQHPLLAYIAAGLSKVSHSEIISFICNFLLNRNIKVNRSNPSAHSVRVKFIFTIDHMVSMMMRWRIGS